MVDGPFGQPLDDLLSFVHGGGQRATATPDPAVEVQRQKLMGTLTVLFLNATKELKLDIRVRLPSYLHLTMLLEPFQLSAVSHIVDEILLFKSLDTPSRLISPVCFPCAFPQMPTLERWLISHSNPQVDPVLPGTSDDSKEARVGASLLFRELKEAGAGKQEARKLCARLGTATRTRDNLCVLRDCRLELEAPA